MKIKESKQLFTKESILEAFEENQHLEGQLSACLHENFLETINNNIMQVFELFLTNDKDVTFHAVYLTFVSVCEN